MFIDETGAKTNITRRHGRCSRDARLVAKVPDGRWRRLSFEGRAAAPAPRWSCCMLA
jgi:hypothetical protein